MYSYQKHIRAPLYVIALTIACIATGCATKPHGESRRPIADFNTCAKPVYPKADLREEHQGTVTLRFLVSAEGKVVESQVAKSSGYAGLDEAARTAIATCHFMPALKDGEPVEEWTPVQYVWTLK